MIFKNRYLQYISTTNLYFDNAEAEQAAEVAEIEHRMRLSAKESEKAIAEIEESIRASRARADADAEFYRASRLAEADALRLTPQFLELERYRAMAANSKIYFASLSGENPFLPPPSSNIRSTSSQGSQGGSGIGGELLSSILNNVSSLKHLGSGVLEGLLSSAFAEGNGGATEHNESAHEVDEEP